MTHRLTIQIFLMIILLTMVWYLYQFGMPVVATMILGIYLGCLLLWAIFDLNPSNVLDEES